MAQRQEPTTQVELPPSNHPPILEPSLYVHTSGEQASIASDDTWVPHVPPSTHLAFKTKPQYGDVKIGGLHTQKSGAEQLFTV